MRVSTGAFAKRGENGGMESRQNELKAKILKEVEAELDGMLKWDEATGRVLTLHEMEERVLEIRQRIGERVIKELLEYQASKMKEEAPVSAESGKRLHNKGKKKTKS
jgi:hypothetical protein